MKFCIVGLCCVLFVHTGSGQNLPVLMSQMPDVITSSQVAFQEAKLSVEKVMADDGVEVSRIKSWEYGNRLNQWITKLDRITEQIDKRAEAGSFSLDNYSEVDKETEKKIAALSEWETAIVSLWSRYHNRLDAINPDFIPLNENEYGCEEIRRSAELLENYAVEIQRLLHQARQEITPYLLSFQTQYDEIQACGNSFVKNQAEGYLASVIQVLGFMTFHIVTSYRHLVDTEVAYFNGQCQ